MAKHKAQTATLNEMLTLIGSHTDTPWFDVVGIDIDGLDDARADGESDDFEDATRIEREYIEAHRNDVYQITWPEHVTVPRFNSDAYYQPLTDE